jgi:AraC-like DNA-binding protein
MSGGAVRLIVEPLADTTTPARAHDRPVLVASLESSVLELSRDGRRGGARTVERIDRATMAIVPAGARHRLRGLDAQARAASLGFGPLALSRTREEYGAYIAKDKLDAAFARPRLLPRTRWVDELLHRYIFEREVCERHDSAAARFLETELVKEIFFVGAEADPERNRPSLVYEGSDLVGRACAFIDAHLDEPLRIDELARRMGASESTLLRAFQRERGRSPSAYAREKRLDTALLLLQSGRYAISEVATRVGYGNLAAFSAAFARRFGSPPSSVRPHR